MSTGFAPSAFPWGELKVTWTGDAEYVTPPTSQPLTVSDADDSDRDYIWQLPDRKDVESVARYHLGGLHPVHLSEIYSGSSGTDYCIIHKLGVGSFSHVNRAVALKFITSASTGHTNEIAIHEYLASRAHDVGYDNILMAVDTFQVNGPNGLHNVIVTNPIASLFDLYKPSLRMIEHLNEVDIIRQILQGTAFLHKNGIVHGDLHCGNISIEFPLFRTGGTTWLSDSIEFPKLFLCVACDPALTTSSVPKYIVANTPLPLWGMQEHAAKLVVKLVDFGCAFRPGTNDVLVRHERSPRVFTAPECIISDSASAPPQLQVPWSYQSDIWTLACSLFEIYSRQPGQNPLFGGTSLGLEIARLLGPIPEQ
ncbi:kinase-like domain-containing protein [Mycena metata]|uniref:non-specific serine/threonine protein kinase n=1 Tax=Mycena metata TaxID=1033252 RepID=A0AAD7J1Q2_9AGAR|nr:kinase-like domain-containing protein [Mycena metata]